MPGVIPNYRTGPTSWQVNSAITGGQLVHPFASNTNLVEVCPASALDSLGVAVNDAALRPSQAGQNPANVSQAPDWVAVEYGVDIDVTYTANCPPGKLLLAGAAGTVTPYTAGTTTYDAIVGRCSQPGGVTISTNAVGSARIAAAV